MPLTHPFEKLLLTSTNEMAHEECGQPMVMQCNFGLFQPPAARGNFAYIQCLGLGIGIPPGKYLSSN